MEELFAKIAIVSGIWPHRKRIIRNKRAGSRNLCMVAAVNK
jgi:hypothetical protein